MVKPIIQIGDKRLVQTSEPIEIGSISSGKIQDLAKDVLDTTIANQKSAAGLSAVQIGEMKRLFVVKLMGKEDEPDSWLTMINPEVVKTSKSQSMEWEGCMSISNNKRRLFGPVYRSKEVEIEYYDLEANKKKIKGSGFFSHLLQHEVDHLNGVLFLSYIDNPKNIWKEDELDAYLDQYGRFPEIEE